MTVKVKDIAGRFRGWTPSMDLLKEVGFEGLGPSGTTAGEIEVEKLCLSVHSADRDCRMVAARGLSVAVHKLSPEFTRALEGLVVLAWDPDREVQHVARSALHIWERYPQVFCPLLLTELGRKQLCRIQCLGHVRKALATPLAELEDAWIKLRQDETLWHE